MSSDQNEPSSSDGEDLSTSSDGEEIIINEADLSEIMRLEASVEANSLDYDAHRKVRSSPCIS